VTFDNPRPYPEWRELFERIEPLLETKTQFSYDDLKDLCGLDVRTDRGRSQFYRFRKHALASWQVWFEVVPGFGYVKIPAGDHAKSAVKRVRWARRKVTTANAINGLAKTAEMTPTQLVLHAQTAMLLEDLSHVFNSTSRKLSAVASKFKLEVSESDLEALTQEFTKKNARLPPPKTGS
jgi:hypothetical protein